MLIPEVRRATKDRACLLYVIICVCLVALLITGIALGQTKKPISKNGLLESISLNALTTQELIEQIESRGVSFQMTAADEQDFRAAGARAELIGAIKANYRSAVAPNAVPNSSTNKNTGNLPAGPPLAKTDVVSMLQGGQSSERIQQFVEVRGVTFSMTPAISREISAAGGNQSLIAAITSRGSTSAKNPNELGKEVFKGGLLAVKLADVTTDIASQYGLPDLGGAFVESVDKGSTAERAGIKRGDVIVEFNGQIVNATTLPVLIAKTPARSQADLKVIRNRRKQPIKVTLGEQVQVIGPDYDELVDQAIGAIRSKDSTGAIGFLQKAVQVNPDQPTAYNLLGYEQLYGQQDIASAESSMRAAIDHGGNATFRVYHDHDGSFSKNCVGSLFISKTGVTYKGDDGVHALSIAKTEITEAKTNTLKGAQQGAFHIRATEAGKKNNYNFAPFTRKGEEANLILKLIQSYH